jgi:tRNA pseudouridine38-40 synthase
VTRLRASSAGRRQGRSCGRGHNGPVGEKVRYLARVAYLGGGFAGWQKQPTARTVQGELERGLERVYGLPVRTVGAGRTDAGVHASGQAVHFDAPPHVPPQGLRAALNGLLPNDLKVLAVRRTAVTFHALNDARSKRYRYRLAWGAPLDPWEALRTWELPARPDVPAMRTGLASLPGDHDFAAFALSGHSGTGARGTVRRISEARLIVRGRHAHVVLEGDGFLRGMARRIVGALVEIGRHAQDPDWLVVLLSAPKAGPPAPTAPPHGLTLERVRY